MDEFLLPTSNKPSSSSLSKKLLDKVEHINLIPWILFHLLFFVFQFLITHYAVRLFDDHEEHYNNVGSHDDEPIFKVSKMSSSFVMDEVERRYLTQSSCVIALLVTLVTIASAIGSHSYQSMMTLFIIPLSSTIVALIFGVIALALDYCMTGFICAYGLVYTIVQFIQINIYIQEIGRKNV